MNKVLLFCLLSPSLVFVESESTFYGDKLLLCKTSNTANGACVAVETCVGLFKLAKKMPLLQDEITFLERSECGYHKHPFVCLSHGCYDHEGPSTMQTRSIKESISNLLPAPGSGVCGTFASGRVWTKEKIATDEYPWMALIEYSKPNNSKGFHCGGVLINDRYVLTAAHCAVGKNIKRLGWKLSSVRLGEWDTNSVNDCDEYGCTDSPVDVSVEEVLPHENYDPYSAAQFSDIALVRLSLSVKYSDFIRPICLVDSIALQKNSYENLYFGVIGWGKTENVSFRNIKLGASISGVSNQRCNEVYNVTLKPDQFCAMRGLCLADSGGQVMTVDNTVKKPYYYSVGIYSFGPSPCNEIGTPGVFTRISSYNNWISRNIRS